MNPEHQMLRRKSTRLTEELAAIKTDPRSYASIAKEHAICRSYVSQIRSGKRRIAQLDAGSGFKLRTPGEPGPDAGA